jgi:hypothetical protein
LNGVGWKKMKWTFAEIDEVNEMEGEGEERNVENEMGHGNIMLEKR